jgi:hypothetical protein
MPGLRGRGNTVAKNDEGDMHNNLVDQTGLVGCAGLGAT